MAERLLVTGAAGRLGSEVCRTLAEEPFEVLGADISYRSDLPVPLEVANLLDAASVYRLVEGCSGVVHLANHPSARSCSPPQRLYRENVTMNVNVFQAALEGGAETLVYASSIQAIAGTRSGEDDRDKPSCLAYLPLDGDLPARPGNIYALSKQTGEIQLRYFARLYPELSCTAIRFPYLASERALRSFRRGGRSPRHYLSNLDEGFSFLHVADAAALIAAILRESIPGYNQLLPAARRSYLDKSVPEIIEEFYPDVPLKVPADQMESLVDISDLEEQYGWTPEHTDVPGRS